MSVWRKLGWGLVGLGATIVVVLYVGIWASLSSTQPMVVTPTPSTTLHPMIQAWSTAADLTWAKWLMANINNSMGTEQYQADIKEICGMAAHDYAILSRPLRGVDERPSPEEMKIRWEAYNEGLKRLLWSVEAMTASQHNTYWATILVECPDYLMAALPRPAGFSDALKEDKKR